MQVKSLSVFLMMTLWLFYVELQAQVDQVKLWESVLKIDQLVWGKQKNSKEREPIFSDDVFIRKTYLDITGAIPTYRQYQEFVKSEDPNKRSQLIASLLNSPGYVSHMSNFFGDLLRDTNEVDTYMLQHELAKWIKTQFLENVTYDKMVYDLIMSEGKSTSNGAIGFYMRDWETSLLDTVSATSRTFLGVRLGCAQCHNSFFDKWTQENFYEFAAFFSGVETMRTREEIDNQAYNFAYRMIGNTNLEDSEKRLLQKISLVSSARVDYRSNKPLFYPRDFKYSDKKQGQIVEPRLIFDFGPRKLEGKDNREKIALWLTSKENRQFARVMANRLWKRLFGKGIVEPVDDYKTYLSEKKDLLLETITDIFIELNLDFKAFLLVLMNTETYQRASSEDDVESRRRLRRMTAHQVLDSLLTLSNGDISKRDEVVTEASGAWHAELMTLTHRFREEGSPRFYEIIRENDGMNDEDGNLKEEMKDLSDYYESTWGEVIKEFFDEHGFEPNFTANGDVENLKISQTKMKRMQQPQELNPNTNYIFDLYNERRSSSSHKSFISTYLLKTFGASDRLSFEEGKTEMSIIQALELLNGQLTKMSVAVDSYLVEEIMKATSVEEQISIAVISVFGREAVDADMTHAKKYLKLFKSRGYREEQRWHLYISAMLNSPEFIFIQ